ncbi:Kinesin light chain OS=Drosophila melanogaster GN=Klc PE=1 SV=1 [Rhizoctonia solani AG-1 IB]|uniref:Kinesin light chain n=1 Tax=Thanatephorus cucumeris (strain AG1-IB / isolate 7/3/14) TaxID=1108050 RepID=A0A0B7G013_THACB|nr:Kinesin light chain OS=Drosophila melanogaster GN=Klc PE=1 SV=1 [Rhizoctonia solani AG-1 IB]
MEGQALTAEREAASALLQDLGYLALAIVHAGAYMRHVHSVGIVQYRDLFLSERHTTLRDSGRIYKNFDSYEKSLDTTWKMCYDLLQEPSKKMLWLMAFLDNSQIHEDLFKRAMRNFQLHEHLGVDPPTSVEPPVRSYVKEYLSIFLDSEGRWDTIRFADVMNDLTSCSLVEFDQMNLAYRVHVLVQSWVCTVIPQTPEFALGCTVTLLSTSLLNLQDDTGTLVFEQQLWLHVNNILERGYEIGADHGAVFAYLCLRMGQHDQAIRLMKRATDVHGKLLGENNPITKMAVNALSLVYSYLGQNDDAVKTATDALSSCERVLGDGHFVTLQSRECLSEAYAQQGRWDEAEALQIRVLEEYRRLMSEEHPRVLLNMTRLAQIYTQWARWDKAEELWTIILRANKLIGEEHPDALDAMNYLAICYSFQGRHDEAEQLQGQIFKAVELWQESHPRMLESMDFAGTNYALLGQPEEANRILLRVMEARKRLLGEGHPDTIKTMHRVAMSYHYLGEYDEAELLLTNAIHISKCKFGGDHTITQLCQSSLVNCRMMMIDSKKRSKSYWTTFVLLVSVLFVSISVLLCKISG